MLVWALRHLVIAVVVAAGFAILREAAVSEPGSLPAARAAVRPAAASPVETMLDAGPSGHFTVDAFLNGTPVSSVVDTGASDIALSPNDARRLGFRLRDLRFERRYQTANSEIRGAPVRLRELRIGQQSLFDLEAVVVDAPLEVSLLGMSFLRRLDGYAVPGRPLDAALVARSIRS